MKDMWQNRCLFIKRLISTYSSVCEKDAGKFIYYGSRIKSNSSISFIFCVYELSKVKMNARIFLGMICSFSLSCGGGNSCCFCSEYTSSMSDFITEMLMQMCLYALKSERKHWVSQCYFLLLSFFPECWIWQLMVCAHNNNANR